MCVCGCDMVVVGQEGMLTRSRSMSEAAGGNIFEYTYVCEYGNTLF